MTRRPAPARGRLDALAPWGVLVGAIVIMPLLTRQVVATEILIFAIAALAFNLLLGYTGLLSFGQASFFGIAAYAAAILLIRLKIHLLLALAVGVLAGGLAAAMIGLFCIQRLGLYFVMLSFAFNQMAYFIAYQWKSVTGGEDGLPGVPRPPLSLGPLHLLSLDAAPAYYAFTAAVFLVVFWGFKRLVESPLGLVLIAIRENETRAAAVGYYVKYYKWLAFTIAGAGTGLAGVLYAMLFGIVPIDAVYWLTSGNIVFMSLIGGIGSLHGPLAGAVIFIWLSESASRLWERWPLLLGLVFLAVVLFFRGGAVEAWTRLATATAAWRGVTMRPIE